ncbi:MAG: hypothetical protein RPU64_15505 [Candidatus Sedimenticola sp. (ex Thyasira tokunagai)]
MDCQEVIAATECWIKSVVVDLILEDDLESAVASHPDPGSIPVRNIKLLREFGEAEMKRRLAVCRQ